MIKLWAISATTIVLSLTLFYCLGFDLDLLSYTVSLFWHGLSFFCAMIAYRLAYKERTRDSEAVITVACTFLGSIIGSISLCIGVVSSLGTTLLLLKAPNLCFGHKNSTNILKE